MSRTKEIEEQSTVTGIILERGYTAISKTLGFEQRMARGIIQKWSKRGIVLNLPRVD